MANVYTDNYIVQVNEETVNNNYTIRVTEEVNLVNVVEYGTPVFVNGGGGGESLFIDSGSFWYTTEKIAVKGFGEYYDSQYKPIFIFEDDTQKFNLEGYSIITSNGINNPFEIRTETSSSIFKITTDEIPVFKMHTDIKTPVSGGLLFYNGDLFFGG
jgi:hypothetical protein